MNLNDLENRDTRDPFARRIPVPTLVPCDQNGSNLVCQHTHRGSSLYGIRRHCSKRAVRPTSPILGPPTSAHTVWETSTKFYTGINVKNILQGQPRRLPRRPDFCDTNAGVWSVCGGWLTLRFLDRTVCVVLKCYLVCASCRLWNAVSRRDGVGRERYVSIRQWRFSDTSDR